MRQSKSKRMYLFPGIRANMQEKAKILVQTAKVKIVATFLDESSKNSYFSDIKNTEQPEFLGKLME